MLNIKPDFSRPKPIVPQKTESAGNGAPTGEVLMGRDH
jgi:hypothetical protein